MHSTTMLLPLLGLITQPLLVRAWGTLGHETVAYLAQSHVSSATEAWAKEILNDTSTSYLANIATWADSYRYTTAGSFSAPYHFIDAEDSPPSSCSVDYARDCGDGGCVVSALANYTRRVTESSLSATEINDALMFIVHFVGDIHQPLHDEALALGGNDIDVTFGGDKTNLHHIWDTEIPEKLRGGYSLSDAEAWAANLTTEVKSGIYKSEASSWTTSVDISDAVTSTMTWATEANAYVCSIVMPKGETYYESGDLDTTYYESTISTVELQIARAGIRLAAWLDAVVEGTSSSKRSTNPAKRSIDIAGSDLLPAPRELSKAKLARAAVGYGCKH